jgi:beta-fructofuranosidase
MALRLKDRFSWDFWIAEDRGTYHLFFLNAPMALAHPDFRHFNVHIGHALSTDLVHWKEVEPALRPAEGPAWDDFTTWTGSTIKRPDGRWMMFYTGTSQAEYALRQRIGAAVSDDLTHWSRLSENPLLEVEATRYETLDRRIWHDEAWRDPWVYRIPGDDLWHMAFTARGKTGPSFGRGVIGHATSPDLMRWTVTEPLFRSGIYGHMEVPQVFEHQGRWYCLFCSGNREIEASYKASGKQGDMIGTHYLMADHPMGPWRLPEDRFLVGDPVGRLYAGRVVKDPAGQLVFLAFENCDAHGVFRGGLSDPMPVSVLPDGRLRVDASRYGVPSPDNNNWLKAANG